MAVAVLAAAAPVVFAFHTLQVARDQNQVLIGESRLSFARAVASEIEVLLSAAPPEIAAEGELPRLLDILEQERFGETGAVTVVASDAAVIASSDPRRRGHSLQAVAVRDLLRSRGSGVRLYYAPLIDRNEFSAIAPVHGQPYSVVVSQSQAEVFGALSTVQRGLTLGLLVLSFGAGAVLFIALGVNRRHERQLARNNAMLRAITEGTTDSVFVKDVDGRYLMINAAGADFVGRSADDVIGRTDADLFPAKDAERIRATDRAVIDSGESDSGEYSSRNARGHERMFSTVRAPYRDSGGQVVGVVGVARDITLAREAELIIAELAEELKRANTLLEAVVQNSTDAIYVKDLRGRYIMVNPAGARMVGLTVDTMVGKTVQEVIGGEYGERFREQDDELLRDGVPRVLEADALLAGELRVLSRMQAPWRDKHGRVIGLVGIARDVTDRIEAERRLAKQAEDLARSNADLERFAYVASHDLQEPLRMISSFVQLLSRRYAGKLDDKADEYIRYAVDGAARMQAMIQGILEISRIGRRGRAFADLALDGALQQALDGIHTQIAETGAVIERAALPLVHGDEVQIGQLLQNLVSNGLKFCRADAPRIAISARELGDGMVEVAVADNGIGIAPEHHARVFEMLSRLHTREEYAGTGMGLAIAQKIVERHGGRIWVESELGQGATFRFTLPRAAASAPTVEGVAA